MAPQQRATLHLRVLGQQRAVSLPVPPAAATVADLLPAARAAADEMISMAIEASAAAGKPCSCTPGCHACCRQFVGVSRAEAVALGAYVNALPDHHRAAVRDRFTAAIARVREAGLVRPDSPDHDPLLQAPHQLQQREDSWDQMMDAYFQLHLDCPFLEDGRCGAYENRPLGCREYNVTSPAANCTQLGKLPTIGVEVPVRLSTQIAEIHALVEGGKPRLYPLLFALAIADHDSQKTPITKSGVDLLWTLAARLDPNANVPLKWRAGTVA